jgi:copper oxidase (laccase) domain-containing protein
MTQYDWIVPDWPVPLHVRSVTTTRSGGVSRGPWQSMNPADHVGDDPQSVLANRARLAATLDLPSAPHWLTQVHGTTIVDAALAGEGVGRQLDVSAGLRVCGADGGLPAGAAE